MRKLSTWASHNPYKARIIIITGHFILGSIACYIGPLVFGLESTISTNLLYICTGIFITTAFLYPLHRKHTSYSSKQQFYIHRKISDFIIATCSFCMMCCVANNFHDYLPRWVQTTQASSVVPATGKPTAAEILKSLEYRDKKSLTRTEKRILKKEFFHQLKVYAKAKINGKEDDSNQAILTILAVLAAVGLLYLLAALACNLSCNGSEGAAIAIGIVGTVALVWLTIFVIKKINRPHKKKTTEKPETGLP